MYTVDLAIATAFTVVPYEQPLDKACILSDFTHTQNRLQITISFLEETDDTILLANSLHGNWDTYIADPITYNLYELTPYTLFCLLPGRCMNSSIINLYSQLLCQKTNGRCAAVDSGVITMSTRTDTGRYYYNETADRPITVRGVLIYSKKKWSWLP